MNNDELILDCIRLLAPLWARIARSDKALAHQGRRALQSAALQYAEGRYARGGNRDAKLHSAYAEAKEALFALQVAAASGYVNAAEIEAQAGAIDRVAGLLYLMRKRPRR